MKSTIEDFLVNKLMLEVILKYPDYVILKHLLNPENKGLHMLYSNFRTLEGIGLFKIMLDYYGYTEFY